MSEPDESSDNVRCPPDGLEGSGRSTAAGTTSSIIVALRKRPKIVPKEDGENDIVRCQSATTVTVYEPRTRLDLTPVIEPSVFSFDYVFSDTDSNITVYKTCCRPLLRNVRDGGGVVVFTFGQTGSGKTYTMLGKDETPGLYGLAVTELLEMTEHNSLTASFFEVYGTKLFDLLNDRTPVRMLQDEYSNVHIVGLTERKVCSMEDVDELVHSGQLLRAVGVTHANDRSSRSHAVLEMKVTLSNGNSNGRITFVDLAGSERASDTAEMNFKTRQEGAEINKSLLALKECIRAMSLRKRHIPFRTSKLTRILRESFVGRCHTCVIATISPCQTDCEDTLNTLRYADRIKELKRGSNMMRPDMPVPCQSCGLPIFVGDRHVCKRQLVPCPHCRQDTDKSELEGHMLECKERAMRCPYCNERLFRGDLDRHNRHCTRYPVRCQLCEQLTARDAMEQHGMHECPASKRKCRFCGVLLRRGALDAHEARCDAMKIACAFCLQFIRKSRMETHRALCPCRPIVRRIVHAAAPTPSAAALVASSSSSLAAAATSDTNRDNAYRSDNGKPRPEPVSMSNGAVASSSSSASAPLTVVGSATADALLPLAAAAAVLSSPSVTPLSTARKEAPLHMLRAPAVKESASPYHSNSPTSSPSIRAVDTSAVLRTTSLPFLTTPLNRPHRHRHRHHNSAFSSSSAVCSPSNSNSLQPSSSALSVAALAQQRRQVSSAIHANKATSTRSLSSMPRIGGGGGDQCANQDRIRTSSPTATAAPPVAAADAAIHDSTQEMLVVGPKRGSQSPAGSFKLESIVSDSTYDANKMYGAAVNARVGGHRSTSISASVTPLTNLRESTLNSRGTSNRMGRGVSRSNGNSKSPVCLLSDRSAGARHGNHVRAKPPTRTVVGEGVLSLKGLTAASAALGSRDRFHNNSSKEEDALGCCDGVPDALRDAMYDKGGGGGAAGRSLANIRISRSRLNAALGHISKTTGTAPDSSSHIQAQTQHNAAMQQPPQPPPHDAGKVGVNRNLDALTLRAGMRRKVARPHGASTAHRGRSSSIDSSCVACPYAKYGCTVKITHANRLTHAKDATNAHLDLIMQYAAKIEQQNAKLRHIVNTRNANEATLTEELSQDSV